MKAAVRIPVTVKCRLGVDEVSLCLHLRGHRPLSAVRVRSQRDSFEELVEFITTVASAGVDHFIVHARCVN